MLATTVRAEGCSDTEILQAYQDQATTVESGFRWSKNPAAISPVWLEKPERIAALARLTVLGWLVVMYLAAAGKYRRLPPQSPQ
jgi:transposase